MRRRWHACGTTCATWHHSYSRGSTRYDVMLSAGRRWPHCRDDAAGLHRSTRARRSLFLSLQQNLRHARPLAAVRRAESGDGTGNEKHAECSCWSRQARADGLRVASVSAHHVRPPRNTLSKDRVDVAPCRKVKAGYLEMERKTAGGGSEVGGLQTFDPFLVGQ